MAPLGGLRGKKGLKPAIWAPFPSKTTPGKPLGNVFSTPKLVSLPKGSRKLLRYSFLCQKSHATAQRAGSLSGLWRGQPPRDNLQAARLTSSDRKRAQRTLRPAQQHAGINAGSGWTIKQCASERGVNEKTPGGWVADHKRELGVEGTARLKPCAPRQSRQAPPAGPPHGQVS